MKHVFFVHSQITKLISLGIISKLSLKPQDIAIITYRGIEFYPDYQTHVFPFSHYPVESFPLQKSFFPSKATLHSLDDFINKITERQSFVAYLPQLNERMLELIVSHPKCSKYNLIEEGKLSFTELQHRKIQKYSKKEYFWLVLNYGRRLSRTRTYLPDTYHRAFKFSDAAFPNYPRVEQVNLQYSCDRLDYHNVLVLEPLVEAGIFKIENYLIGLEKLIKILKRKNIETLHYKFHPEQQLNTSKSQILKLFKAITDLSLVALESDISLEEIAINSPVDFYSISSSMLYYAKSLGSSSYSFLNLIPPSQELTRYFEIQPQAFKENISYIANFKVETAQK